MEKNIKNETILILGGSGFLGRFVVRELAPQKAKLIVAARQATMNATELKTQGEVGQISLLNLDANNHADLESAIKKATIVVNLIGILYEKGLQNFHALHVEIPKTIAQLCHKYHIKKLVHISALGIDESSQTSKYAMSKLQGEQQILQYCPTATILRPSMLFGEHGHNLISTFAHMARLFPALPLIGGGKTMLQPLYARDLATLIQKIILAPNIRTNGKIYEVGGPEKLTLRHIVLLILKTLDKKRLLIHIPFWQAKLIAFFLALAPNPILTIDLVETLSYNNIVKNTQNNALDKFNVDPTTIEGKLKDILI